jgi:hypothetical protein
MLGRPVIDKTPVGALERQHLAVQVVIDVKKSTAPSTVIKLIRGVLAAFPTAMRIGVICHHQHLPTIIGTAKNSEHRLDAPLRQRIVKTEYFRSGEGRGSNKWTEECDLLVVVGTPRVPPPAIKLRLIQWGMILAASRDGRWEADYWSGTTTSGRRITVCTSAYRDHDWYAAHRSLVRAELIQAIGRGRSICENGIPVVVLSNEPLGLPILEIDVQPVSDTAVQVMQTIRRLSEQNPKGESPLARQPTYRNKTLNSITLESCSVSSTQVAETLGITDRQVRHLLNDLLPRGLVDRIGQRGGWRLTAKGEQFLSAPAPPQVSAPGGPEAAGPPGRPAADGGDQHGAEVLA